MATKSYATLQVMAPTNVKTVHQTSLLHIESNLDRLGLLSPTHDKHSQQQSGQITLQSVLINKSRFFKATHRTEMRKVGIPRSMVVGPRAGEASAQASIQPPKALCFLEKPRESCPFAVPCGPRRKKKKWSDISFFLRNLPIRVFNSRAQGFSPPWLVDDLAAFRLRRIYFGPRRPRNLLRHASFGLGRSDNARRRCNRLVFVGTEGDSCGKIRFGVCSTRESGE